MAQLFLGNIIHTRSLNEFEAISNGFIAVGATGTIVGIGADYDTWHKANPEFEASQTLKLAAEQFLMPGLVDCHIHAPQVAQIGLGLDLPLLSWLNKYTFPLEAKFADPAFAAKVYTNVVKSTIRCGTTLASYFATNHKESTVILAQEALRQGQRALVGKVCSNCNSPDYYVETTEESLQATKEFVEEVGKLDSALVKPTITPRFALSCSAELMSELGKMAKERNLHVQTHISESVAEVDLVNAFCNSTSYAEAYDKVGLLTNKTVLAHAVHVEDDEILLLKKRGTSIAHCPASNTMISSGLCDVHRFIKQGVKVGLGTDVSAGNSVSIKDTILRALDVSHHLEFIKKQHIKGCGVVANPDPHYTPLDYKQAIYLATLGGAEALTLNETTGNFIVGKDFDALLVDASLVPIQKYELGTPELLETVQRFIYVGDDRNIIKVFVAGKQIKSLSESSCQY